MAKVREAVGNSADAAPPQPLGLRTGADATKTPASVPSPAGNPSSDIASPTVRAATTSGTASKAVGKLVAGFAEVAVTSICARPSEEAPYGYLVEGCDEEDLHDLENAAADGFLKKFPDADVPWWLGMVMATGNLYVGARRNRRPREVPIGGIEAGRDTNASLSPKDAEPPKPIQAPVQQPKVNVVTRIPPLSSR